MTAAPLRVFHVVATAQRRGAEVFAADLVRALAREEVEQRVAILRDAGTDGLEFDPPTERLVGSGWRLPGVRVDPGTVRALRRLVRGWRPHVVQAHGGESFKYAVGSGSRAPVIYRRIGWSWVTGRARTATHGRLMRRAARVVAVAETVARETVERFGVPADRVVTIPRGVDPERLRPTAGREATRSSLGVLGDGPVVLSLGALTWEKDPLAALDVAGQALREIRGATYLVAGEGPLAADMQRAAVAHGLEGRVRLLGSRADVADLLAASDVLLLSSRSEGMPGAVIEAGMAGVPTVAFAVAGVPEVIVDGETGLTAPAGDRLALGELLRKALADAGLRSRLGDAARDRYRAAFGIDPVALRFLEVYREVAGLR